MSTEPTKATTAADVGPNWLVRIGTRSWYIAGVLVVVGTVGFVLNRAASILVPLLLAIILGILFAPVVDALKRRGVPTAAGAGLVLVLIIAVVGLLGTLLVQSILSQLPVIEAQLASAMNAVQAWLHSLNLAPTTTQTILVDIKGQASQVGSAALSLLFSGLSGFAGLVLSAFMAMYMLFFILSDAKDLAEWVGDHIGLREDVGRAIVDDALNSIRQYFRGETVVAVFTSVVTGAGLAIFHVPLIGPIMAVTFVAVYVPYLGAIVSSAFAVLIALGAGGPPMALAALAVVLIVQNGLQGIVVGWAIGGALKVHPLVVILATVMGGIFGGILGAVLGAPVAAIGIRAVGHLRETPAED